MRILLNGAPYETERDLSVGDLLRNLDLATERIAVELNGTILRRAELDEVQLASGDAIEVVTFVGGG